MCGICGLVDFNRPIDAEAESLVRGICRDLAHRGPDSEGVQVLPHAVLGHRRLAVIDLSPAGHQPMANEDGTVWVVFNGEIYNHRELHDELAAAGHRFRSRSDTEVLLHGYEQWGLGGLLERLRGMFALALWDGHRRELCLARDRHGVKPLYYHRDGGRVVFSSEVRPLYTLAAPTPATLSPEALDFYLAFGFLPPDTCLVRGIGKLPPATALRITAGGTEQWRYWSLDEVVPDKSAAPGLAAAVDATLAESVRLRLESDVPLGSFLSGGIDSGLVTALTAPALDHPLHTITVGFTGQDRHDERSLARLVAQRYGTAHQEIGIGAEGLADLPRLLWLAGEPFADHSLLPTALVCRAARKGMTVALTGDGGDELFAGYYRVVATYWGGCVARWLPPSFCRAVGRLLPRAKTGPLRRLATVLAYAGTPLAELYTEAGAVFPGARRRSLYQPAWRARVGAGGVRQWVDPIVARLTRLSKADAYARLDLALRLPGDYLVKVDVASNACALECRSPFLDHKLTELSARIPMAAKLPGGRQKGLLRRLAADYLPPELLSARKQGFGGDIGTWLREAGPGLFARLGDFRVCGAGAPLDEAVVRELARAHFAGEADHGEQLWNLLCLELWWRLFIDRSLSPDSTLA